MRAPRWLAMMVALAWLSAGAPARAQDAEALERARVAFQEGDVAENAGDCATAIQKFRSALEVKETTQLHLRIGRCEEKLGKFQAAMSSYAKGQSVAGTDEELLALARRMRSQLDPRMPRLTVRVPDAPDGATVSLDGAPFTGFGVDTPLDPGLHVVEATAPGRLRFEARIDLKESDKREVTIDLPIRAEPSTPDGPSADVPVAPIVLYVLGVGFLGASIGMAVRGGQLLDEADQRAAAAGCQLVPDGDQDAAGAVRTCNGSREAHATYEDDISTVNLHYGLAAGFGAAAGVSLVVASVVLAVDLGEDKPGTSAPAARLSPWFGPKGAGVGAVGRF
jgi:hypothetical protein